MKKIQSLFGKKAHDPWIPPDVPGVDLDPWRLGVFGEEETAADYRYRGYVLIGVNYKCRFGELDLVAVKDNWLVFIEVRTRRAGSMVSPAESIDIHKRRRIIAAAQHYLLRFPELNEYNMRFDVAEVIYEGGYRRTINIIENAFTL